MKPVPTLTWERDYKAHEPTWRTVGTRFDLTLTERPFAHATEGQREILAAYVKQTRHKGEPCVKCALPIDRATGDLNPHLACRPPARGGRVLS